MTLVDVFFAAAILGGWTIAPVALFAAIGALIWASRRARRLAHAARQWRRDTRHEPDSSIDDTELADWLAIGVADYQAETDHNPQAGLDRLRDEIQQHREEEQQ